MTPEERADLIIIKWIPIVSGTHRNNIMGDLAAVIREAVEQDREEHNNRVAHVVKEIRAAALEEAEKFVDCIECKLQIRALREVR